MATNRSTRLQTSEPASATPISSGQPSTRWTSAPGTRRTIAAAPARRTGSPRPSQGEGGPSRARGTAPRRRRRTSAPRTRAEAKGTTSFLNQPALSLLVPTRASLRRRGRHSAGIVRSVAVATVLDVLDHGRALWTAIAWLGAAAIALALGLPAVWWEPLHADEMVTQASRAGRRRDRPGRLRRPRRAPLHFLVEWVTLAWPDGLVGLRVPSIVFFVLALPAAGLVAGLLVDARAAVLLRSRWPVRRSPSSSPRSGACTHSCSQRRSGRRRWRSGPRGAAAARLDAGGVGAGLLVYIHPVAPLYSALVVVTGLLCAPAPFGRLLRIAWAAPVALAPCRCPSTCSRSRSSATATGWSSRRRGCRGSARRGAPCRAGAGRARARRAGRLVLRARPGARSGSRGSAVDRPRAADRARALGRRPGRVLHLRPDRDELVPSALPPAGAPVLPPARRGRLPRALVFRAGRGRLRRPVVFGGARLAAGRRRA